MLIVCVCFVVIIPVTLSPLALYTIYVFSLPFEKQLPHDSNSNSSTWNPMLLVCHCIVNILLFHTNMNMDIY